MSLMNHAALADPAFVVPSAPEGPAGGVAWLRASVARFSNGAAHRRRRALAVAGLATVDPDALRLRASEGARGAALAAAGFAAIGTTSLGVAAANGLPDAAGLAREETVALTGRLVRLPCPVTVDIEAGFSHDPGEVGDLAAELADLGVAGINLEDGRGPELADPATQVALIRAVKQRAPEMFLNARVDTYWLGMDASVPATLNRARQYMDAGADGIFVPGLASKQDIGTVTAAVPVPLNVLYQPALSLEELAGLGVRRVSTGSLLFRAALHATVTTALAVRDGDRLPTGIPSYAEIDALSR